MTTWEDIDEVAKKLFLKRHSSGRIYVRDWSELSKEARRRWRNRARDIITKR